MLIGLSGYARTGKDSVAKILVEDHGFTQVAFADPLRMSLFALDPFLVANGGYTFGNPPQRLSWLLDRFGGNEGVKNSPYSDEWRRLQQKQGTEAGRDIHGEDCWVEAAFRPITSNGRLEGHYVFSDCRFVNEARSVNTRHGEVWRIQRPGVGPANDHISEVGLDEYSFDAVIYNNSDLDHLRTVVADHIRVAARHARG